MTLFKYFARVVFIIAGVLLLMVVNDLLNPYRSIEVKIEPDFIVYPVGDIRNPENQPFVLETAAELGVSIEEVSQEQFDYRQAPNTIDELNNRRANENK